MKPSVLWIFLLLWQLGLSQSNIGIDIYNRYVWRGTDFGNAAALQPHVEFKTNIFTVGAWSSWAIHSGEANENDIYIAAEIKNVTLTLTDYFFPSYSGEDNFFNYSEKTGSHLVELSLGALLGPISITGGYFFIDPDKSTYLETKYGPFSIGAGNGMYTVETDEEADSFQVVNMGLTASQNQFTASYIINPQQETSFLVFGITF